MADVLTFDGLDGQSVKVVPTAITSSLGAVSDLDVFQVVQTSPRELSLRLLPAASGQPETVRQAAQHAITRLLQRQNLPHVAVLLSDQAPKPAPGGKYRSVVPLGSSRNFQQD